MNGLSRVNMVVSRGDSAWILGKMARRLQEELPALGISATISDQPSTDADINHWILYSEPWSFHFRDPGFYSGMWKPALRNSTMLITHIDDSIKAQIVKETIERHVVEVGVCLSRMTRDEMERCGVPRGRLCSITPGQDGAVEPRRIVVGITSRVYPDGRKREHLLGRLAESISLDSFRFEIFGAGWEGICSKLRAAGAEVEYDPGSDDATRDYQALLAAIPDFDYYLYTGVDEGSMGFMDAMAAGVRTIAPPVGFTIDIPGALTHPFVSYDELEAIFRRITAPREESCRLAREYDWRSYARRHATLWKTLVADGAEAAVAAVESESPSMEASPAQRGERWNRLVNVRRSTSLPMFRDSIRFRVRGALSRVKRALAGRSDGGPQSGDDRRGTGRP